MLKKLHIKDFQCHKKLTIEFSPTVTTIVGSNDSGKSAILRALRFVCLNKPRGKSFIRRGSKQTIVSLEFDSHKIVRKTGRVNSYSLNSKKFKAFRNDVPKEIKGVVFIDEINFQKQHEATFWFGLSAGQVAKELNSLVDLETIDKVQSSLNKQTRNAKAKLAVCGARLSSAKEQCRLLDGVKPQIEQLGMIEEGIQKITDWGAKIILLTSLLNNLDNLKVLSQQVTTLLRKLENVISIGSKLQTVIYQTNQVGYSIKEANRHAIIASTPFDFSRIRKLQTVISHFVSAEEKIALLSQLVKKEQSLVSDVTRFDGLLEKHSIELEKKLAGRCPLCGTILSDKTMV